MRTFGKTSMRSAGATVFLAMLGLTAALVPLALYAAFSPGKPAGYLLYLAAAILAGGVVGRVLRRS